MGGVGLRLWGRRIQEGMRIRRDVRMVYNVFTCVEDSDDKVIERATSAIIQTIS